MAVTWRKQGPPAVSAIQEPFRTIRPDGRPRASRSEDLLSVSIDEPATTGQQQHRQCDRNVRRWPGQAWRGFHSLAALDTARPNSTLLAPLSATKFVARNRDSMVPASVHQPSRHPNDIVPS